MFSVWNKWEKKQGTVKLLLKMLLGMEVCRNEYYCKFSATSIDFLLWKLNSRATLLSRQVMAASTKGKQQPWEMGGTG